MPLEAIQDLRGFRLPPGFRGRAAWFVQLWWLVQGTAFRWSPQVCYGWRRWLLRLFGASVGQGVLVRSTASITYPWKVSIGDWSWIGDEVVLYSLGAITIGLALGQKFIGLIGGEIAVSHLPSGGRRFTIILPMRAEREPGLALAG